MQEKTLASLCGISVSSFLFQLLIYVQAVLSLQIKKCVVYQNLKIHIYFHEIIYQSHLPECLKCGDGLLTTGGREGAVGSLILTMNALWYFKNSM